MIGKVKGKWHFFHDWDEWQLENTLNYVRSGDTIPIKSKDLYLRTCSVCKQTESKKVDV